MNNIMLTEIDNFNISIAINQLRVDRVEQDIFRVHFFAHTWIWISDIKRSTYNIKCGAIFVHREPTAIVKLSRDVRS